MKPEQHEMVLMHTHSSGEEEWLCPICGRRFLMSWPPAYKRTILEPGDQYAYHAASKGEGFSFGVASADDSVGLSDLTISPQLSDHDLTDEHLSVWGDGLSDIDFGGF